MWGAGQGGELAADLARRGCKVTLLDPNAGHTPANYIGSRAPHIQRLLFQRGVEVEYSTKLIKVEGNTAKFAGANGFCARRRHLAQYRQQELGTAAQQELLKSFFAAVADRWYREIRRSLTECGFVQQSALHARTCKDTAIASAWCSRSVRVSSCAQMNIWTRHRRLK